MASCSALLHPLGFRAGNRNHFLFGAANQDQGVFGAGLDANPAAHAAQLVDLDGEVHAEGLKLAVLQAVLAGYAQVFIDSIDECGLGDGVGDTQFADAAQNTTRAGAAVADIRFAVLVVADRVHQTGFRRDLQRIQRFFHG